MTFCATHQHAYINICSECYGSPILDPIRSRNGDMFFYSAYWQCWSRVLAPEGAHELGIIEVDLTPVNSFQDSAWERVKCISVRAHRTARRSGDLLVSELPASVVELMKKRLPPTSALLDKLIHDDLMPQIDWYKYRKVCNGGAALGDILK